MTKPVFDPTMVRLTHISGTVINSQKHSETHITSSGGGGYVGPNGGYVPAPKVQSQVQTTHEFWLRTANGVEKQFQFSNLNVPLCLNQEVTVLIASKPDGKQSWVVELINHNAKTRTSLIRPNKLVTQLDLDNVGWHTTFKIFGLAAAAVASVMYWSPVGAALTFGTFIYLTTKKYLYLDRVERALLDHIGQAARQLM